MYDLLLPPGIKGLTKVTKDMNLKSLGSINVIFVRKANMIYVRHGWGYGW